MAKLVFYQHTPENTSYNSGYFQNIAIDQSYVIVELKVTGEQSDSHNF